MDLALADPNATAEALAQFVRDHLERAGRTKAVVGLSGGVDSAVSAAVAVRALGPDRVVTHTLPDGQVTPSSDIDDAERVAEFLGIGCRRMALADPLNALESMFQDIDMGGDDVAWGNVKARLRMIVNYFVAHAEDGLVLGTGNRSEVLIGYFTKYGDAGVDLLPLGHLYKTQVRELARFLELPERVIDKPPSAGLWAGQTDEDELGLTYETLDRILVCLEDRGLSAAETAGTLDVFRVDVERVAELVRASAHKRAMPPMPDVD